jgi:hypothetical protein
MSTQSELQPFDAPALLVEARYRRRTLCAQVLSSRSPRGFTIGRGRRADAPVDPRYLPPGLAANDNHTLVAPSGDGFVINLAPAMRERAERSASRIRIPCGEVVFDISAAAPPPPVPRSWLRPGWSEDARVTGAVALGMLLLLLLVRAVPSDPHALSLDDVGKDVRFDPTTVIPRVLAEPQLPQEGRGPAGGGGGPKVATSGPTGTAGTPRSRPADARRATRGPATRQDARQVEAEIRANTILSLLDGPHIASVDAVFDNTRALGDHEKDVFGHMVGTEIADAWGMHGLAARGTGPGGADTGKPMIGGPGGLRTIGLGHGGPNDVGLNDRGVGRLGHRAPVGPNVIPSLASVRGGLDKEIVRRIVRQHLNEVRYCYGEALARKPTLAGRVVTQFTIASSGKVLVSVLQSSTLGAPAVESCIVTATRRWLYPQPLGGGIVTVTYPFQLAPAGG